MNLQVFIKVADSILFFQKLAKILKVFNNAVT